MKKNGIKFQVRASDFKPRPPAPRRAPLAGVGRLRKIAMIGGGESIQYVPWQDPTWETWVHASCRHLCKREPDLLWDLHPPELWRDSKKKTWDPKFYDWIKTNRVPIMMQQVYPDVPASIKYPFEQVITEFPRGYMTNHVAYMIALALQEGVTHIGLFGCDYHMGSEYGPQRGCAEYWLGVAEGRGVHVQLPPKCDLLNKPSLLYGYESHPNGVRDPSYSFTIGPMRVRGNAEAKPTVNGEGADLISVNDPKCPALRDMGIAPNPNGFEDYIKQAQQMGQKEMVNA